MKNLIPVPNKQYFIRVYGNIKNEKIIYIYILANSNMSIEIKKLDMKGAKVFYIRKFFKHDHTWFQLIDESVVWDTFFVNVYGKKLPQRRKSCYIADENHPYKYSGVVRNPSNWVVPVIEMKKNLDDLVKKIKPLHPKLNAVLLNRYKDGDDYIGKHSDDEKDLNPDAFIVSVSLGATRDFIFTHKETNEKVSIELESGSVILMGGDCQKNWKHEIPKRKKVKDPRINLTFRSIIKKN